MYLVRYLITGLALLGTLLPGPVQAWTAQEIRAMPPYCAGRYARINNPAEYQRWEAQYGPDFLHTHHLCNGIGLLNNYYKAKTPQERKVILNDAMGNLNYMIQHAKPDFKLMPEVYWYRSQVYHLMDRLREAIGDLRKAQQLDPKQARFYLQAADHLNRLGSRKEAFEMVSEGLRHLPDHKGLQERHAKLGGKPPYPEPYAIEENKAGTEEAVMRPARVAVFDLSRNVGAARKEPAIVGAGAYILLEVREDPKSPEKVYFRLSSMIPQPAARIAGIGIDTGRFDALITRLDVADPLLGPYYPLRPTGGTNTHAYWPGFTPDYRAHFTIDPKKGKMYDPNSLPPGSSLTLLATLAPGARFEDVVQAMKTGLTSDAGLRFGVIAHHLMGYRPDPTKTIMDDAGFLTGRLIRLTGFDEDSAASQAVGDEAAAAGSQASAAPSTGDTLRAMPPTEAGQPQQAQAVESKPAIGSPTNPWCRFCPETAK